MGSKPAGRASSGRAASGASAAPRAGWLRLYPRWWRERYAEELAALMEARPPNRRARLDLVRGAFDAHLQGGKPGKAPRAAIAAALISGGAWTIGGIASVGGPTPPDWPGYLQSTLPVALVGVVGLLVASLGIARLAWASSGPTLELAVLAAVVGHVAWALALAVAILGGPYGAVTAIAQTVAAIATLALGLVLLRAGVHPIAEAVTVAGAALLMPTPAAWLIVGATWTGIGLWRSAAGRSGDWPRAVPG